MPHVEQKDACLEGGHSLAQLGEGFIVSTLVKGEPPPRRGHAG
jgi:hypothetical protein